MNRGHMIDGSCLGIRRHSFDDTLKRIIVAPQAIPFIEEFFKHEFEKLLQENKIKYTRDEGSGDVVLSCAEPKMDKEEWENSCKRLKSYIDQVEIVSKIMSLENWELMYVEVKKKFAVFKTKIQIIITLNFNKNEVQIKLTGKQMDVTDLLKQLNDFEEDMKSQEVTQYIDAVPSLKYTKNTKRVIDLFQRRQEGQVVVDLIVKRCDQLSTRSIEDSIMDKLREKSPFYINEVAWNRNLGDGKQPVLVFCVISSRIGLDVDNAMSGVHDNTPVVLVLLHFILRNLLREDLSDDEDLLNLTLKSRMRSIAHFAYSANEGLYACPQNKTGLKTLLESITPFIRDVIRLDQGHVTK